MADTAPNLDNKAAQLKEADTEVLRKLQVCKGSDCENEAAQLDKAEETKQIILDTIQGRFEVG